MQQFLLTQLQASGCQLPTTTSSTTSTSTTSPSTTSTTINADAIRCATLLQAFNATTDPTARAFIQTLLTQAGCGQDSTG